MFKQQRTLSYANVAATLALVFSMSGGALAANHYLIHSTKQISPAVLKKLTGKTGKTGQPGSAGPAGPAGAAGKAGETGPAGTAQAFGAATVGGALNSEVPSKNIASVSKVSEGKYCITPATSVSVSTTLIVATVDANSTNGSTAEVRSKPTSCSAGQFEVDTFIYKETGSGILSEFHAEPFSFIIP